MHGLQGLTVKLADHRAALTHHLLQTWAIALVTMLLGSGCRGDHTATVENASTLENDSAVTSSVGTHQASRGSASDVGLSDDQVRENVSPATPVAVVNPPQGSPAQPRLRPADARVHLDADALDRLGIGTYESRRLRLHADIEPEVARTLPPLMDALFEVWEQYFGPLPPAPDGSDFQMTGYLMRNQQLFRDAGLLPWRLPTFLHGRHRGQEFWMNDQEYPYYRRHLMLHEGTHCFMEALGRTEGVPIWYLEGMAELFATHHQQADGTMSFGVMPQQSGDYVGFGRIQMIERDNQKGRFLSIDGLRQLRVDRFGHEGQHYAWCWALCKFLNDHPRDQEAFHRLAQEYPEEGFHTASIPLFAIDPAEREAEWALFIRHLCYGFDIERAAIDFGESRPYEPGERREAAVDASRGWQSTGIQVEAGQHYEVVATGQVTLCEEPRPWISEPDGVSIHYSEGRPIGRLVGMIVGDFDDANGTAGQLSEVFELGSHAPFVAPASGVLFLCVNDFWSQRADNRGSYAVSIERLAE